MTRRRLDIPKETLEQLYLYGEADPSAGMMS